MAGGSQGGGRGRPKTFQEVLGAVVARFGLERPLDDYRIWQAWDEVVGPAISRNAQPQKLGGRRLVVVVKNAGWMQELSLLRRELCERLNAWMGREVIGEIFLVVGKVEPPTGAAAAPAARSADGGRPLRAAEDTRPRTVSREELESAIARLWQAASERGRDDAGE
jgi:hypothetical protein